MLNTFDFKGRENSTSSCLSVSGARGMFRFYWVLQCRVSFPFGGKTVYVLVGEQQRNEAADAHAAAGKMLKKITFPEMDDDALPSTYCIKVLGCLGKWSAKMYDLAEQLKSNCASLAVCSQLHAQIRLHEAHGARNLAVWVFMKDTVSTCLHRPVSIWGLSRRPKPVQRSWIISRSRLANWTRRVSWVDTRHSIMFANN